PKEPAEEGNGTVTVAPPDAARPAPPAGAGADSVPQHIGRFEIRRLLGVGGFGRVYEASDPSLKRSVALMVARAEQVADADRLDGIALELGAAGLLLHPHIVAGCGSGRDGPHVYIASAFVPGQSLAAVLEWVPEGLPPRQAAGIVRKLAEALA